MPTRKTIKMPRKPVAPAVRNKLGEVNDRQKGLFLEAFEDTFSIVQAAAEADISAADLRKAFADDAEFRDTFKAIRTGQGEKVQKAMIDRALKGDPVCARLVLPALLPEAYGNKVTIDINVNTPEELEKVPDDKLAEIKAACLKLQSS